MTANQIAAEGNRIQERQNEWSREHNDKMRDETMRHNKEMESLQASQVAATEHGNNIQENWNKWQQNWQQNYQYKLEQYKQAQEDKKIAIQQELAYMEQQRTDAEVSYKSAMEANLAYMQGIASDQLALETSFKEWQKAMGEKTYTLNEFEAAVKAKQVEYDYSVRHEQNLIARDFNIATMDQKWAALLWDRERTNAQLTNALTIANYNYELGKQNLRVTQENLELYRKQVRAQNFQSYSGALFGRSGIIPGTVSATKDVMSIIPFGGFTNVTAKQIAQSLFSD